MKMKPEKALAKHWGKHYEKKLRIAREAAIRRGITTDYLDVLEKRLGFIAVMDIFYSAGAFGTPLPICSACKR